MVPDPLPLPAFNPGPYTGTGNVTWLVPGGRPLLVDAGTGDPRHLDALAGALGGCAELTVLVTHAHSDHASGAPAIAARWPQAVFAKMPWPEADARYPVAWEPVEDGRRIAAGGAGDAELQAIHTPGHAPDHLSFYHAPSRTLFSGDLLLSGGTIVIPPSHGGSLLDYLASLRRVLALAPARALPAHGPPIEDPAALIEQYLAHRQARDGQVLTALANGLATPEAIAERIYRDLAPGLERAARETVLAHLIKLETEGRVVRAGEGWKVP